MLFLTPNQQCQSTEGKTRWITTDPVFWLHYMTAIYCLYLQYTRSNIPPPKKKESIFGALWPTWCNVKTSCWSTDSERPHRCCNLSRVCVSRVERTWFFIRKISTVSCSSPATGAQARYVHLAYTFRVKFIGVGTYFIGAVATFPSVRSPTVFRPHHTHNAKMRPISTDVAWSVCLSVCLLDVTMSCAKTDKPTAGLPKLSRSADFWLNDMVSTHPVFFRE